MTDKIRTIQITIYEHEITPEMYPEFETKEECLQYNKDAYANGDLELEMFTPESDIVTFSLVKEGDSIKSQILEMIEKVK